MANDSYDTRTRVEGRKADEEQDREEAVQTSRLPGQAIADMVKLCNDWYSTVESTLTSMILEVSLGDDMDPFTRDGPPNRWMQKVSRELNAVSILVHLLQTPFDKGVSHEMKATGKSMDQLPLFRNVLHLSNLCFRLLQQMMKGDHASARQLFWFWQNDQHNSPLNHLGKGINAAGCIIALFQNRHEMLREIRCLTFTLSQ